MDGEGIDTQASPEVTPASSENDLLANKSEDSLEEEEEEDDDDIDKMLNEHWPVTPQAFDVVAAPDAPSAWTYNTALLFKTLDINSIIW